MRREKLISNIRNIPDFPIPGIQFKDVTTLFKDQGIYNALLAVFLLYGIFTGNLEVTTIFVLFVIGAAGYGAATSSPKILLTQGGPAILTLISILLFN